MPTIKPPLHFPGVSSLPSAGQKLIEFLYPPDQLLPAPSLITAPGLAGSRLRQLGKYLWSDNGKPVDTITKDPYGLVSGPIDRRQFLDRFVGNTTRRAKNQSDKLWQQYEITEKLQRPLTTTNWSKSAREFEKAANFGEQFNNKYGWPNPVINPEAIGSWRDPRTDYTIGTVGRLFEALKQRIPLK